MDDDTLTRTHPQLAARARQLRTAMTPMESRLWAHLRDRRCAGFKFRRQVVMDRRIADFVCPEAQVVVEVDGSSHNRTVERDAARDAASLCAGYQTLRFTNAEVRDHLEGVLEVIRIRCVERLEGRQR